MRQAHSPVAKGEPTFDVCELGLHLLHDALEVLVRQKVRGDTLGAYTVGESILTPSEHKVEANRKSVIL